MIEKLHRLMVVDEKVLQILLVSGYGTCSRRYRRRYRLYVKHCERLSVALRKEIIYATE